MTEVKKESSSLDDETSFNAIQENFQRIISALVNDNSLDAFRLEYQKLYDAFQQSHQNNQQLIERIRLLNSEINSNSSKVQSALQYSQEDQRTITILRKDFEKAWSMVEALHARESRSKEIIEALKSELQHLSDLANKQGDLNSGCKERQITIQESISKLKSEVKSNSQVIETLNSQLKLEIDHKRRISLQLETVQNSKSELDKEVDLSTDTLNGFDNEGKTLSQQLIEIKQKNRDLQEKIDEINSLINTKEQKVREINGELKKHQPAINDLQMTNKYHQDKLREAQKQLESQKKANNEIQQQKSEIISNTKIKQESLDELNAVLAKETERNQKSLALYNESSNNLQVLTDQISDVRRRISVGQQELIRISKNNVDKDSKIRLASRNIEATQQSIIKTEATLQKVKNEAESSKIQGETLENQVLIHKKNQASYQKVVSEISSHIEKTQQDIFTFQSNTSLFELQNQRAKAEIQTLEKELKEINKQRSIKESTIKELKDHHAVDARKYLALTKENDELQSNIHFLRLNIIDFKEAITKHDNQCMEVHSNRKQVEQQITALNKDIQNMTDKLQATNTQNSQYENDTIKKVFILHQSDLAISNINKDMKLMSETIRNCHIDIFKRTKEIENLREKCQVIQDNCQTEEKHYMQRITEVDQLKQKLQHEVERHTQLIDKKKNFDKLQEEVNHNEKELLIAQARFKMLSDETEHPIMVHRWTLLEATNPEQFQAVQMRLALLDKISLLLNQERQLKRTKEITQKKIDKKMHLLKGARDVSEMKALKEVEEKLKEKIDELNSLSIQTQRQKEETDEWKDRVSYQESLIVQQKEQFFLTKLSQAPVAVPIKEPQIKFNRAQAPRNIVPRLKIIEPKSDKSIKSNRNNLRRNSPVVPILPPLIPAKTVR